MPRQFLRYLEAGLLVIGLALLATFLAFRIHSSVSSQAALEEFAELRSRASGTIATPTPAEQHGQDFGLWSKNRIAAYKESLAVRSESPIAVLTIRRLALEVPVFDGTGELVLNKGVGRIIGTARPGESGNIGIAGHRDGFFRCLKDIHIGDEIELATLDRKTLYLVDAVNVVQPEDVGVLQPRARPALTLVTCYPFYFVGPAPKRYIVRASVVGPDPSGSSKPDSEIQTHTNQEVTK
jgi:sortase A